VHHIHSFNYNDPIQVHKVRKNHSRPLKFDLPLFFWYFHSYLQLLQIFVFPKLDENTASSCNKLMSNICGFGLRCSLSFSIFPLLVNNLPGCIIYHRKQGKWILNRPFQNRMGLRRHIICTLPFLICSD